MHVTNVIFTLSKTSSSVSGILNQKEDKRDNPQSHENKMNTCLQALTLINQYFSIIYNENNKVKIK